MTDQERFIQEMKSKFGDLVDLRICLNGDGGFMAWDARVAFWAWQAAQQKEGYVFVKPQLDSDAKAKMIGEYNVPVSSICPDCTGEGCCECNNTGTISQNVTVSWTTVKQIYRDGIFFMAQAAQEPT